ncbi:hypothetical protein EW145_g3665 [Phellinidium pouzarii]|uniref:Protein kinase domain-containing protein n=1 Tax=Phellinidium pouzarii TaxID=167371 RepID=A0A4S4L6B0_9AGAM|nr:hypothetical protein EW145_g3665 [Phellinidium pouzarii]
MEVTFRKTGLRPPHRCCSRYGKKKKSGSLDEKVEALSEILRRLRPYSRGPTHRPRTTSAKSYLWFRKTQTPPRPKTLPAPVQVNDSPLKKDSMQKSTCRTSELAVKRQAIPEDLGLAILVVDLDILPPLPAGFDLDSIVESLKNDGHVKKGTWKHFQKEPKSMKGKENNEENIFDHLRVIFDSIVKAAANKTPHNHTQTVALYTDPYATPISERESTTKPDGYMMLKESEKSGELTRSWYDFAVTLEAKKSDGDKDRDDDLKHLIRVFLSFAFASKIDLGWDPTVSVSIENGIRIYHFTVRGEVFDAVEVMSDLGADAVIGRASRVFKVKRSDGTFAILKDVWVDDDRELEHILRRKILYDVKKKYGEKGRKIVKRHLMTPITFGLVEVDGQTDHTTNVIMHGEDPSFTNTFRLVTATHRSCDAQQTQDMRRIVFKEVAETLYSVKALSDVFTVLKDISAALKYIHGAGWLHRDISAGNTYLYNKRGILGDLEYAKEMGVNAKHEVRTGTLDFMAVEVSLRDYIFKPSDPEEIFAQEVKKAKAMADSFEDERPYSEDELTSDEEAMGDSGRDDMETAGEGLDGEAKKDVEELRPGMSVSASREPVAADRKQNTTRDELASSKVVSVDSGETQDSNDTNERQPLGYTNKRQDSHYTDKSQDSDSTIESRIEVVDNVAEAHSEKPGAEGKPGIWYNPLHDMESIWWIAVWELFLHEDLSEKNTRTEMERILQADKANLFFPQLLNTTDRFLFFVNEDNFERTTEYLPGSFQKVVGILDKLRRFLRTRYGRAEEKAPRIIDKDAFMELHDFFVVNWKDGEKDASGIEIVEFERLTEKSMKAQDSRNKRSSSAFDN